MMKTKLLSAFFAAVILLGANLNAYAGNEINALLFYNRNDGAGAIGFIAPDHTFHQTEFDCPGSFSTGWTHIVSTTQGVLFYNANNQLAAVGVVSGAGRFQTTQSFNADDWTHIVNVQNYWLLYNTNTGAFAIGSLDLAGQFGFTQSGTGFSTGWTQIIGTDFGALFYNANTGVAAVGFIGVGGQPFQTTHVFSSGAWTHIVVGGISTIYDSLLFYNANDGTGAVGYFSGLGQFQITKSLSGFRTGWTHIVSSGPYLLFYNAQTGMGTVGKIVDGSFSTTAPLFGLAAGWTHIVGNANGLLFYNANTGAAAVGFITGGGQGFQTTQTFTFIQFLLCSTPGGRFTDIVVVLAPPPIP